MAVDSNKVGAPKGNLGITNRKLIAQTNKNTSTNKINTNTNTNNNTNTNTNNKYKYKKKLNGRWQ